MVVVGGERQGRVEKCVRLEFVLYTYESEMMGTPMTKLGQAAALSPRLAVCMAVGRRSRGLSLGITSFFPSPALTASVDLG